MMFHRRSTEFDPRVSAIAGHLRGIEKELGAIGNSAGRRASAGASTAVNQVVDAIRPVLNDIEDRFRMGQQLAVNEAASLGNQALNMGSRVGNEALDRISAQAKESPLATIAVAVGVGILIGFALHRS